MGDLVPYDEDDGGQVPAHILAAFGGADNTDLTVGVSTGFPILSYKGKVWTVSRGGTRELIADDAGDPRPSVEVVIVKANAHISKLYYSGGYVEGSDERPTCYSNDGEAPEDDSLVKQSPKCAICPRNQWGSRITEAGAKGKECADSRRLAVAPSGDLEDVMLMRVPAASLKELVGYAEMLARRKTPYQAVITKIGFDHTVAFPKLTFKPISWLDAAQVSTVAEVIDSSIVKAIIGEAGALATGHVADALEIAGAPPANLAELTGAPAKQVVTEAELAKVLAPTAPVAPVVTPAPAKAPAKAAGKTKGFGGSPEKAAAAAATATVETVLAAIAPAAPVETPAQAQRRALLEQMAALDAAEAAANEPAAAEPVVAPKRDHTKLLAEAGASLEEVLGVLDD